jgi:diguanylate cyclase (GGDEF)-like protein/PAS domain S-box-containing protein
MIERDVGEDDNYRQLFVESRDAVVITTSSGLIRDVNPAACRLFGSDRQHLLGTHFPSFYVDPLSNRDFARAISETGYVEDYEVQLIGAGDRIMDCLMSVSLQRDNNGKTVGYQGLIRDVSERKRALEQLRESEERFRALSENVPDIIFTIDREGYFTYVNPAWKDMLGHLPEDVLGKSVIDFMPDNDSQRFLSIFKKIRDSKQPIIDLDGELTDKNGIVHRVSISVAPNYDSNDQFTGMVGLCRDITRRRDAEEALKIEKAYAEALFENLPEAVVVLDNEDRVRKINREFRRMFAYTLDEVEGKTINELIVPENLQHEALELTTRAADGERVDVETIRRDKNGLLLDVSILGTPITIDGRQVGVYGIYRDISKRKAVEDALIQNEEKYGTILEYIEDGYYEIDLAGNFVYATAATAQITGSPRHDFLGHNFSEFCSEDEAQKLYDIYNHVYLTGKPVKNVSYRFQNSFGEVKTIEASVSLVRDALGEPMGFRGIIRDMTARKQAEEALRESEERHRTVLETAPDPMVVQDAQGRATYINPAFTRVFGWGIKEMDNWNLDHVPLQNMAEAQEIVERINNGESFSGLETKRYNKSGDIVDVSVSGAVFFDSRGSIQGSVLTLQDISERKKAEEELRFIAYHDLLTGLPNRKSFYMRLEENLVQSQRRRDNHIWALLFLDLDRFKQINDTLGHDVGDELLVAMARRIGDCLRRTDYLFRLGGDEFTIILNYLTKDVDVAKVARKIRDDVARPFSINGYELCISTSIGIAVYPHDGNDVEKLVKNADMAMYAAKEEGSGFRFFTEEMNRKALERMTLEGALRNALQRGEFLVHYQPLVDHAGTINGMEALLRWQHPELGLVPPAKFIAVAEETGAIVPIGEWVLLRACEQARKWQQEGFDHLYVAVNLSPRQFREADLVETVERVLGVTGLSPNYLKLEVTEGSVMDDPEDAIQKMERLRDLGIRFSIDDFGTGYSSLSYLKRFPIDTLKIDRSFVTDSMNNLDDQEIIKTIISMAKNLKIETVAEGVETVEQKDFLTNQGCLVMQGYYFGRPVPGCEFEEMLKKQLP